ncbi:dienelactone hydrolase family protein [Aestuariicoccus sp. MJ-SS9]|uniref:dienelactone hydrolase family protein n=1 Tax=Aestuariicoccus sp. MJ-SS9 TaxID=3079855 RepID=UPI002910B7BE|nr:dienelactone hydrolase family protein [Aestuariicoccus sp. MJ-SS9]MDU8909761.1 dienelactone hydrolase family protein [Aestuariicoccus sp. MJ-SS9]
MMIELTAADGHKLDCWMTEAEGARKGGIVILQEIFGVTDQLKGVAARYAALGYDVAIPALFDRFEKGAVIPYSEAPRGRDMMLATDLDTTMKDVDAAVQALKAKGGNVAVIGFCWGGGLALRAAQVLDIACAVPFYGTRLNQYLLAPLKAPVEGHFGAEDGHVPPEMLDAARAYFPDMGVHLYPGAGHAFANNHRPADFVEAAAEEAHARAEAFIGAHM